MGSATLDVHPDSRVGAGAAQEMALSTIENGLSNIAQHTDSNQGTDGVPDTEACFGPPYLFIVEPERET